MRNSGTREQWEAELIDALDRLDAAGPEPVSPSLEQLRRMAESRLEAGRRRARRDMFLFLAASPVAVGLALGSLSFGLAGYIVLQAIVLAGVGIPAYVNHRKKRVMTP